MRENITDLLTRYLILILFGLGNLWVFYAVFTPLTIYPVLEILRLIYGDVSLIFATNTIYFNGIYAEIIPACIAGSAYYLLLILNLTTPMKLGKRLKNILFLFGSFFVINIFRIVIFAILFSEGFRYFDLTHRAVWYFGSTILVVLIWFGNVWLFNIKEMPVYSDIRGILNKAGESERRS